MYWVVLSVIVWAESWTYFIIGWYSSTFYSPPLIGTDINHWITIQVPILQLDPPLLPLLSRSSADARGSLTVPGLH